MTTAHPPPSPSTPTESKLIRKLSAKCDVVVENFKVGGLAKYGLDYPAISAVNPCTCPRELRGGGWMRPLA
jgi:crotonobetainyl-CoA:carnitine CoA-transferase CaiB-like acyl-CoA transferase